MKKYSAFILVLIVAILGGSIPVASKFALEAFDTFTLVAIRFLSASIVIMPFVWKSGELNYSTFRKLFPIAIIGAVNPILLFIALGLTRASIPPLIYATVPALTAIYLWKFAGEKLSKRQTKGLIIGFLGAGSIIVLPVLEQLDDISQIYGNGLIFLAAIAFMLYGIKSKEVQIREKISPIALTFYFSLVTLLVSLPFAVYELFESGLSENVNTLHIFSGLYIGIFGTGLFYFLYQFVLKKSTPVVASLFTYLQPVAGIILGSLLLAEPVTWALILGGSLAVVGAKLASSK